MNGKKEREVALTSVGVGSSHSIPPWPALSLSKAKEGEMSGPGNEMVAGRMA